MIVANMTARAGGARLLRNAAKMIAPQVDRLNLVLDAHTPVPKWAAAIPNLNPVVLSEILGDTGKFFSQINDDDLVFLMDDGVVYPSDYAARMLEAFRDIAIDRKIIGAGGTIYSDFFDGRATSQLVYSGKMKLAQHQFVNQLDTGTVLCRGIDLPRFASMKDSPAPADLQFAIHCFRSAIPMICIAHDGGWLKRNRGPVQKPMSQKLTKEIQEIAGFGRLPATLLDAYGRIPCKTHSKGKIAEPTIALLNSESAVAQPDKPRMTVVSWSLGSNSAGRAYTLADLARSDFDVELTGALIPSRGGELWAPLRDATIPIRGFFAEDMASCLSGLRRLAQSSSCEIAYVSKPRFTGFLLGMLLSAKNNCPLVLDIDDLELSFIKKQSPLGLTDLTREFQRDSNQFTDPASETWTRFAETLVGEADAVTLSNATLRERYEGTLVRHARDETLFAPDEARRAITRRELGFRDNQAVALFVGTPRPHKGLIRIATAIAARNDDNFVLCIIGAEDEAALRKQLNVSGSRNIRIFPPQSLARLPDLIRSGDAVCLLQDPSSSISDFQIPAKLSEALAMGLPVLASRVAPFADLIAAGAVRPVDTDEELGRALDEIQTAAMGSAEERAKRRDMFLAEFSYAANRPRLRHAVESARQHYAHAPHARDAALQRIADYLELQFSIDILQGIRR